MNKEEIIKEVIAILETSDYVDSSEHLYDGIKQIKREITYSTIHDFLWALESPTVLDVDGKVILCAKKIKLLLKQELLDDAYENYKSAILEKEIKKSAFELTVQSMSGKTFILPQEEFINKCKTDTEFSQRWGLKIVSRKLTNPERYKLWFSNNYQTGMEYNESNMPDFSDSYYEPTPTKLITITYNDKTIESYE